MATNYTWTKEADDTIRNNWNVMSQTKLSHLLNTTVITIRKRAKDLGVQIEDCRTKYPDLLKYKKLPGCYSLLNTRNQKKYIGSSADIQRRLLRHLCLLKQGEHKNQELQKDWSNGDNIIICDIQVTNSTEEATSLEQQLLTNRECLYNKTYGIDYTMYCDNQTILDKIKEYMSESNECILWRGYTDKDGYGRIKIDKHSLFTHRLMWVLSHKQNPPLSLKVCHSCDNPTCLNINHLFLGTDSDNAKDRCNKKRHYKKISKYIDTIKQLLNQGVSRREIEVQTGMSESNLRCMMKKLGLSSKLGTSST